MKITARLMGDQKVALDCKPLLGDRYTIYAVWVRSGTWMLVSGRAPTAKMLDAIDQIPGLIINVNPRT